MIDRISNPQPRPDIYRLWFDHPLLFQEKARRDDAVRGKEVAKNLAGVSIGQVLGYRFSAVSIVRPHLLLEQQWVINQKAVYSTAGLGVSSSFIKQKAVYIRAGLAVTRLIKEGGIRTRV